MPFRTTNCFVLGIVVSLFHAVMARAQPYGLDTRAPMGAFLNNVLPPAAPTPASGGWITVEAFPNLTFDDPVFLTFEPRTNRLYVCERQGKIWHFVNSPSTSTKTLLLDLTAQTQGWDDCGVLGLAFHPEFNQPGSTNRNFIYVYYQFSPAPTAGPNRPPQETPGYNRLSRFTVNPANGTAGSEQVLINQFDEGVWHNGGGIFFGPDGFLYLSNGDEGAANDSYNNTQKINAGLFSGVLRLDVNRDPTRSHPIRRQPANGGTLPGGAGWVNSSTANYYIPNDNPWVNPDGSVLEEFYALGLRSPHRMTLDPLTQRIWLGDVGQGSWEEVDIIEKGGNYQWAYMEGLHPGPKAKPSPLIGTDKPPLYDYAHANGNNCVIGGYVYRGAIHAADLFGKYIFGDNGSGRIWTLDYNGTNAATVTYLCNMPAGANYTGLSSFGVDQNNELYMCKMGRPSKIYKLGRTGPGIPEPPALLSQTAAFSSLASLSPSSGIIPFTVNSPLWSDAAIKQRWMALPNDGVPYATNETIAFSPTNEWTFPFGTVFIKHFELATNDLNPALRKRLETRLLVRDTNGSVYGVTYKWRADNSDADLLTNSVNEAITITTATGTRTQTWYYPSRQDCITCHNPNAKHVLGVKTHQLNGDFGYPGGVTDNQLRTWNHLGLFNPPLNETNIASYLKAVSVTNQSATLEHRVRSYIDANCSLCHRPNGVQAYFDARLTTPLPSQGILNGLIGNDLGVTGAKVVVPLSVAQSIMHLRMNSLDALKMPPLAKNLVDTQAVATVAAWINSLTPPNIPPTVALTSPRANDAFTESSPVFLTALASDSDGTVAKVEFFANGVKLGEDTSSPFAFTWTPGTAGTYLLTAIATDDDGTNASSAGVRVIINSRVAGSTNFLVSSNSFWRYLDNGSDQGIVWRGTNFNDSSWASGPAQLGYGDGDEATVVNGGPTNSYFITTYFRRTFVAQNVEAFTNLAVRVRRDDGIIVYLNGSEVYRDNMPTGAVNYLTLAPVSVADDGNTWFGTNISAAALCNGTNWIAAEIHQRATNSSDISFDLELTGIRGVLITNPPPVLALASPANNSSFDAPALVPLAATITSNGWAIGAVEFYNGTILIGAVTNTPFLFNWSNVAAGTYSLSARALYASDRAVTSSVVNISVIALVAAGDNYTVDEDTLLTVPPPGILANDSGRGTLTPTLVGSPAHGQLTLNPNGSFSYAPFSNFSGGDSFTYVAGNGSVQSAVTTVTLTINPVNDPPVATSANRTTLEDTPLSLVLNGSDVEGAALSYAVVSGPMHGVLSGMPPNLTYTPSNNFSGTDGFMFKVNDGQLDSAPVTVSITVAAVNDPPAATAQNLTTGEDTALDLVLAGSDVEGATLSYIIVAGPEHGVLSGAPPNLTYAPSNNFFGRDGFTFKVNDGDLDSAPASVTILVLSSNDPPVISSLGNQTIEEDHSTAALSFTIQDPETDADALGLTRASSNADLIPEPNIVLSGSGSNRTATVTPAANKSGTATITLTVTDPDGGSASTSFTVTVTPVNDSPTLSVIADQEIDEDTSTALLGLTIGDIETPANQLTLIGLSSNPVLVPQAGIILAGSGANRTISVMPATNQHGTAVITLVVADTDGSSASNSFTVVVRSVNDAPSISTIAAQTMDEDSSLVALAFTVSDVETAGDDLQLSWSTTNPTLLPNDHLVLSGSGTNRFLSITPAANQFGTATVSLVVTDGEGARATSTFEVTVEPINDAPTLDVIADLLLDQNAGPQTVALSDITSGPSNEDQSLSLTVFSSNPALIPTPGVEYLSPATTGSLRFTPIAQASGTATLTVMVEDSGDTLRGGTNRFSRSFQVRVVPIPVLKIALDGNHVLIKWPAASTGYRLYSRSDLSTDGEWIPVTNVPATVGEDLVVELDASEGHSWFRLLKRP